MSFCLTGIAFILSPPSLFISTEPHLSKNTHFLMKAIFLKSLFVRAWPAEKLAESLKSVSDDTCLKKSGIQLLSGLWEISPNSLWERDKNLWFWHSVLEPALSSESREGEGEGSSNVESRQKRLSWNLEAIQWGYSTWQLDCRKGSHYSA